MEAAKGNNPAEAANLNRVKTYLRTNHHDALKAVSQFQVLSGRFKTGKQAPRWRKRGVGSGEQRSFDSLPARGLASISDARFHSC